MAIIIKLGRNILECVTDFLTGVDNPDLARLCLMQAGGTYYSNRVKSFISLEDFERLDKNIRVQLDGQECLFKFARVNGNIVFEKVE